MHHDTPANFMDRIAPDALQQQAEPGFAATLQDLAAIVHELRTPLIAIMGNNDILAETQDPVLRAECSSRIRQTGTHLLEVVTDILTLAKANAGQTPMEVMPVNLPRLAVDSLAVVSTMAEAKGLRTRFEITPGLPLEMMGDPRRLRQILINLLSNAVKFSATGVITLRIAQSEVENTVLFTVTDQGPGMTEAEIAELFQPFHQVQRHAAKIESGTGLGLAICRSFAQQLNGTLTVHSKVGKGSEFTLAVPLIAPASLREGLEAETMPALKPDVLATVKDACRARPLRILLVDDNPLVSDLIVTLLLRAGHQVSLAPDGATGFEQASTGNYDLVLLDKNLGDMDGIDLARQIRALIHLPKDLILVGLTAYLTPEDETRALNAGMNAYLSKMTSPLHLLRSLGVTKPIAI